ncbi:MAG TPA: phosphoribosyltransferase [Stellaceae bacterium]|nr:phosphoribosyltransferase [Stellaceae bacterium]
MKFRDRQEAGRRLAAQLLFLRDQHPVVLALPRGGVPVGYEVAEALAAPLDVILVRKIGAPGMPELALGAIVGGERQDEVLDERLVAELAVPRSYLAKQITAQAAEIERRRGLYCRDRPPVPLAGRCAIVVDDGIATGATVRAALLAIGRRRPSRCVLAAPVAPQETIERLRPEADEIVCLSTPEDFYAIGQFYDDFHQLSDDEVLSYLDRAAGRAIRH